MEKTPLFCLMLVGLLACGCIENPKGDATTSTTCQTTSTLVQAEYSGVATLSVGDWSEYSYSIGDQDLSETIIYLGEGFVGGKTSRGMEVQLKNRSGQVGTFQLWVEEETNEPVKYLARINGRVLCTEEKDFLTNVSLPSAFYGTLHEYLPKNALSIEPYVIPSGKNVYVARFMVSGDEVLVSSQVPFGIVKKKDLLLADYGSDAGSTMTKREQDECIHV